MDRTSRNVHGQNIRLGCVTCRQNVNKLLLYKCTQNQFTVQVYKKPVYCTSVNITSLLVNNERNVNGQNIKECTWLEHYQG